MQRRSIRRVALLAAAGLAGLAFVAAANGGTYIVLYKQHAVPSGAATTVANAGGSIVASYPEIGVVIARSDAASFRSTLLRDSRVWGAASTGGFGVHVDGTGLEAVGPAGR